MGRGEPAVVIETGLGDQMDRLTRLQQLIAKHTTVFAYNRAGYGQSEPGPLPRDCSREANELKALLEKAQVPGPYVLVGHSLGALNVQLLAARHPDLAVGMVLLDPPPLSFILGQDYQQLRAMADQMTAQWQATADSGAASDDPQERRQAAFLQMIASEHRQMFGESARQVAAISSFGDMPIVIVAAGLPNPAFGEIAEEYQRYWIEQSRSLADKSAASRFILAEGAGHHLHADAPDLVAESILSVVREVRASSGPGWN